MKKVGYALFATGSRKSISLRNLMELVTGASGTPAPLALHFCKPVKDLADAFLVVDASLSPERQLSMQVSKAKFHSLYPENVATREAVNSQPLELQLVHTCRQLIRIIEDQLALVVTSISALYVIDRRSGLMLIGTQHLTLLQRAPAPKARSATDRIRLFDPFQHCGTLLQPQFTRQSFRSRHPRHVANSQSVSETHMVDEGVQAQDTPREHYRTQDSGRSLPMIDFSMLIAPAIPLKPIVRLKGSKRPSSVLRLRINGSLRALPAPRHKRTSSHPRSLKQSQSFC